MKFDELPIRKVMAFRNVPTASLNYRKIDNIAVSRVNSYFEKVFFYFIQDHTKDFMNVCCLNLWNLERIWGCWQQKMEMGYKIAQLGVCCSRLPTNQHGLTVSCY